MAGFYDATVARLVVAPHKESGDRIAAAPLVSGLSLRVRMQWDAVGHFFPFNTLCE